MKFKLIHILFFLFALNSCQDSIELDLGNPVEQIVIDAVINQSSDTQFIYVTRSKAFLDNSSYTGYQTDTVGIYDTSTQQFYEFSYKGNGVYYYVPAPGIFKIGNTYQLIVRDGQDTYISQSTLDDTVSVDSFTYANLERGPFGGQKGNYVTLWAKDNPGLGDYYWFRLYRNDSLQAKAFDILLAIDNAFSEDGQGDGDLFIIPIRESFNPRAYRSGETARVEILSISREMFYYLNLIRTQLNNQGLFAVPPSNIPSNIFCLNDRNKKVLGFFCMAGKSETNKILFP